MKLGKAPARRRPKQRRARQTVEAVLDAVAKVLKRDGVKAVTTNRIAEVAGVSIGSVYQYFPDTRDLYRPAPTSHRTHRSHGRDQAHRARRVIA
jgi:DNA-binding transcriptional regulator YbjK